MGLFLVHIGRFPGKLTLLDGNDKEFDDLILLLLDGMLLQCSLMVGKVLWVVDGYMIVKLDSIRPGKGVQSAKEILSSRAVCSSECGGCPWPGQKNVAMICSKAERR